VEPEGRRKVDACATVDPCSKTRYASLAKVIFRTTLKEAPTIPRISCNSHSVHELDAERCGTDRLMAPSNEVVARRRPCGLYDLRIPERNSPPRLTSHSRDSISHPRAD
jgi:hypothetical protein